ncbi:MAG: HPr(Ser) kinase/phosphatase [Clostridia bacterium]|nr:HPr(Ser) kinase/phosphatase [Clostridia bacterium]
MNSSSQKNSVALTKIIKDFNLEVVYASENLDKVNISRAEINRPGLSLTGFFDYFDPQRIQVLGRVEAIYLSKLTPDERIVRLGNFLEMRPVCIVIARNIEPFPELVDLAKQFDIPILRTPMSTSSFISMIISALNVYLAPKITRHGVLVEVYGIGVLILGDSGIGKSETAIELIKRGHRLIADDAVEISKVSEKTLVGQAPAIIRYYMELRGIGIVDVRRIFGMGAVKETEKIELVIKLEPWVQGKMYDRMGLDNESIEILGINVPSITVPVRPGRNLAVILEIAAMNFRLKMTGYDTAKEFNKKLEEEFMKNT